MAQVATMPSTAAHVGSPHAPHLELRQASICVRDGKREAIHHGLLHRSHRIQALLLDDGHLKHPHCPWCQHTSPAMCSLPTGRLCPWRIFLKQRHPESPQSPTVLSRDRGRRHLLLVLVLKDRVKLRQGAGEIHQSQQAVILPPATSAVSQKTVFASSRRASSALVYAR